MTTPTVKVYAGQVFLTFYDKMAKGVIAWPFKVVSNG